jgi:short-subunit dehydrogenase
MLQAGSGTIVTVTSVLGHLGCANLSDYTSSKAALVALHSSLRAELQRSTDSSAQNIKTILVLPGQLSTPMFGWVQTPSPFLAPVVEPVEVAKDIVRLIDAGEGGEVAAPVYARLIGWWHVLPPGVQQLVRTWSGVDAAVEESNGKM